MTDTNGRPASRAARFDVVIVGGGPAGLSAALWLGRCRRRVLVVDAGRPRNAEARSMHGFLTRDGLAPGEFLRLGREELSRYGVEFLAAEVSAARRLPSQDGDGEPAGFEVRTTGGRRFRSRKLLLATGMRDLLPPIPGIERFYGSTVHHCPYCDGWEHRDRPLAACGTGKAAAELALALTTWSGRVTACTGGRRLARGDRERLARHGIVLREEPITAVEGTGDRLERLRFASGPDLECEALFFHSDRVQRSTLPASLGCEFKDGRAVRTRGAQHTCTPGLYLAGDADGDVQFVIVAAAEGARAAVAINHELQREDLANAESRREKMAGRQR